MKYPDWWNREITLYNRHENTDGTVEWYKTNIPGCFVKNVPLLKLSSGIGTEGSQNIVRIRKSDDYLPPQEWMTVKYRKPKFTLQSGDIVVIGNVSDHIDEYSAGSRSSDILQKYKSNCFVIASVSVNDSGSLAHYKISG